MYYVAYNHLEGNLLVGISDAPIAPGDFTVDARDGDMPDLTQVMWHPETASFIARPATPVRVLSKLAFLQRLTMAERLSARAAAKTDPVVEDMMAMLELAEEINLDDPQTRQGVGYFVSLGLVTPERAAEVLA